MSHMIVQYVITNSSNQDNHNKGDITPVIKAAARKSTLMQITRARAVNGFL
jgi:hypothetical protein